MKRSLLLMFIALFSGPAISIAANPFLGRWINVDEPTDNLTRIEIVENDDGLTIQSWGAARGGEIDQGKVRLVLLGDTAGSLEMRYGFATWDHKFADVHMTLQLEKQWLLSVEDFTIFKDDSGRANYRVRGQFKRVAEAAPKD